MIYLSQLLKQTVYLDGQPFGKILDIAVFENRPVPPVSKFMIERQGKKITIAPEIKIEDHKLILINPKVPSLPYDENDFYLNEDLLDKQVIDIDGKRLVRVNDVLMEINGQLKVIGIDIGFSGILRRLGRLDKIFRLKSKTLPWTLIEAFDYQTGAVRIKLTQNNLNYFHPSELADILEEIGTKERLGIFDVLDAQKAAEAIEETDSNTQSSILEELSPLSLKSIVNKMLVSKIADILYKVNPLKISEILKSLDTDKAKRIENLSIFPDDVAGGLMDPTFFQMDGGKTVKEALQIISVKNKKDEAIIVTNCNEKVAGIIHIKDLVVVDSLALLKDLVTDKKFVYTNTNFSEILRIFSNYNLHILPVVDNDKKLLGIITIDTILAKIEEKKRQHGIA